jgi:hypothetical protein
MERSRKSAILLKTFLNKQRPIKLDKEVSCGNRYESDQLGNRGSGFQNAPHPGVDKQTIKSVIGKIVHLSTVAKHLQHLVYSGICLAGDFSIHHMILPLRGSSVRLEGGNQSTSRKSKAEIWLTQLSPSCIFKMC